MVGCASFPSPKYGFTRRISVCVCGGGANMENDKRNGGRGRLFFLLPSAQIIETYYADGFSRRMGFRGGCY